MRAVICHLFNWFKAANNMCKTNSDVTCVVLTKFDVVLDSGVIQVQVRGMDRSSRFPVGGVGVGGGHSPQKLFLILRSSSEVMSACYNVTFLLI